MADYYSDQLTNATAAPPVVNPTYDHQRLVKKFFSYTVPTGNIATSKTIAVATIPKGARLLGGYASFEAMSTAGGTATAAFGDGTTADKYVTATSVDSAATVGFGLTIALQFGAVMTDNVTLTITTGGEAWLAGKKLYGYVEYLMP